ncbi:hypothetical protein Syun_027721 [Stephania yunnanensis]|uniref:Uncharacterized protein n=1 Tax=Stephania yunnanensis TaxID=152371 RepID=A0AAP0EIH5_9MAGN
MNVEDHGKKSRKKHVKKHKKRKERDENVNFINQDGENDHSEVLAAKHKSRKKAKLSKFGGEDAQHKRDPNRTSFVENGKAKRKLGSRIEAKHVKDKKKGNKYKKDHSNGKMAEKPVKGRGATIVDVKLSQHGRLNLSLKQKSDGKKKYLVDGMEKSDHINKKKVKPIKDNEEKIINNPSMNVKKKKVKPIRDNEEKMINKEDPSMIISDQNAEHVRNYGHKKLKNE